MVRDCRVRFLPKNLQVVCPFDEEFLLCFIFAMSPAAYYHFCLFYWLKLMSYKQIQKLRDFTLNKYMDSKRTSFFTKK